MNDVVGGDGSATGQRIDLLGGERDSAPLYVSKKE